MIRHSHFQKFAIFIAIRALALPLFAGQSQPIDVTGNWQVAWQGRLGTELCLLHLDTLGAKVTGTFQNLHTISPLSGTLEENKLTLEVHFQGARPYTVRFTGTATLGKLEGNSQASSVSSSGPYMGHGGEVVQPEHPWTAKRVPNLPALSGGNGSQSPPTP